MVIVTDYLGLVVMIQHLVPLQAPTHKTPHATAINTFILVNLYLILAFSSSGLPHDPSAYLSIPLMIGEEFLLKDASYLIF